MSDRLTSLDTTRAIAILGILWMNITAFAAPEQAYLTPIWKPGLPQSDVWVFTLQRLFFEGRFVGLFCLLLGASVALLTQKQTPTHKLVGRYSWLMVFGIIHGALLWYGDILAIYGMTALVLLLLIKFCRPWMGLIGLVLIGLHAAQWLDEIIIISQVELVFNSPMIMPAELAKEQQLMTGDWSQRLLFNANLYWSIIQASPGFAFGHSLGLMCLGVHWFDRGFFHGKIRLVYGPYLYVIGLSLSVLLVWLEHHHRYDLTVSGLVALLNQIVAVLCLPLMLTLCRALSQRLSSEHLLVKVGRFSLTLYLLQSVLMVALFQWWIPELFGNISRTEMMPWVVIATLVQLFLVYLYQLKFRQGPMERLWRTLVEKLS